MALTDLDKLFWMRSGLGVVTGVGSQLLFGCKIDLFTVASTGVCASDYQMGILLATAVFLASYYVARFAWGKKLKPEEATKLYTTGLGAYVMLFLFFWVLLFTMGFSYLTLAIAP